MSKSRGLRKWMAGQKQSRAAALADWRANKNTPVRKDLITGSSLKRAEANSSNFISPVTDCNVNGLGSGIRGSGP
jgi:hypothetical protein